MNTVHNVTYGPVLRTLYKLWTVYAIDHGYNHRPNIPVVVFGLITLLTKECTVHLHTISQTFIGYLEGGDDGRGVGVMGRVASSAHV